MDHQKIDSNLLPARALILLAMSALLFLTACQGNNPTTATSRSAVMQPETRKGSVLRILCDIPGDIGPEERTYPGRIDWPGFSESFDFKISKKTIAIPLKTIIPARQKVRVFFVVNEDPKFSTCFHRTEWFYRGRLQRDPNATMSDTYSLRLSQFRDATTFSSVIRP